MSGAGFILAIILVFVTMGEHIVGANHLGQSLRRLCLVLDERIVVHSASTEEEIGSTPAATPPDVDAAVAAAEEAGAAPAGSGMRMRLSARTAGYRMRLKRRARTIGSRSDRAK